jgi:hypothetical protein
MAEVVGLPSERVGRALRLLASAGWVDKDPDVVRDLLGDAVGLVARVADEAGVPDDLREEAKAFLSRVTTDVSGDAQAG